jgi:hypothetical protein
MMRLSGHRAVGHRGADCGRARATAGLVVLAGLAGLAGRASPAQAQSIPADAQPTCTVAPATFNGWFQSGTAALNGVVNPANSVTFPNTPNCSFYLWSEQMFLWLTSPAPATYGGGGGRIFDSPTFYDVSTLDASFQRTLIPHKPGLIRFVPVRTAQLGPHRLPIILDKRGRMFEIEPPKLAPSGKQLLLDRSGAHTEIERATLKNGKPVFLDKAGKTIASVRPIIRPELLKANISASIAQKFIIDGKPVFLDGAGNVIDTEEGQADGGVLESQNGSLIYYATMVNDVYAYFLTGVKDGAITPGTKFPTSAADLAQVTTFATAHGKTFPDPEALAIEVKSSWIDVTGLPNASSYITMKATIPTYDKSNASHWVPNGQATRVLALTGMHVVGSTKGHPEMIWATFEHFGNTPNAAYSYNSTTGLKTVAQSTAGTWLFASSGAAAPFNDAHMQNSLTSADILAISPHTITPSNILRMKPWGAASNASPNPLDANAVASNTEIVSINHSVLSKIPAGDVRVNYFMLGSTWTIGGAAPTTNFGNPGNTGGNIVGTSQLSNTTMETYSQGNATFVAGGSNCFFCHRNNTTDVSHVFPELKPLF